MDASIHRPGIECLAGGSRVLPSTRHQCDRRRLPDDVRRRCRLRPRVHALAPETHRRTADMKRRQIAWILILIGDVGYIASGAMAARRRSRVRPRSTSRCARSTPQHSRMVRLRRQLGAQHFQRLDGRRHREQRGRLGHQGLRNRPGEVTLPTRFVSECVEDGERGDLNRSRRSARGARPL